MMHTSRTAMMRIRPNISVMTTNLKAYDGPSFPNEPMMVSYWVRGAYDGPSMPTPSRSQGLRIPL